MEYWYDIKDRGIMGSGNGEIKVVTILGRTVRWTREGLEYEADGKHRRELLKRLGLNDGAKAVVSPMVKSGKNEVGDEDDELEKGEYTGFRGEVALLNYMGQDRSDVQYTTNQVSRMMVRPTVGARRLVKRVGRYLVGAERVVWKYGDLGEKGMELEIDVYVDSDWAGAADRKSTSGGVVMMNGVAVKHWSRTQSTRALSVGEAEYYAVVTGTAEGLGVKALGEDMGMKMRVAVWTDSDACRSVANRRGLGKLYAGPPPLEAKKMLFRRVAGIRGWRRKRGMPAEKLMFIDVRKAYLNARVGEDVEEWVELPEEFWEWGRYARLRRWLYGMRPAAAGWEEEYSEKLRGEGFKRGKSVPTVFRNDDTGLKVVVHGDDFTVCGERRELEKFKEKMKGWYDIKDRGIMGSGNGETKEVTILGRTVRWTKEGVEYEADEKHRKELLKKLELEDGAKAAVSPMVKEEARRVGDEDDELPNEEKTGFRGEVALMNYMGQDRSDVQYAANQVSRGMARPTVGGRRMVKRIARYLVGAERVVWRYGDLGEDGLEMRVDVYVDSDWAGGADRKSTSGGVVMMSGSAVKHWSRTQRTRAISVPVTTA
jgi:hypothetical protein